VTRATAAHSNWHLQNIPSNKAKYTYLSSSCGIFTKIDYIYHKAIKTTSQFSRSQWLAPIVLTTQEAEIKRIAVQSNPRQIVHKTYLQNTQHKEGLV
jgi:hypothetical protein